MFPEDEAVSAAKQRSEGTKVATDDLNQDFRLSDYLSGPVASIAIPLLSGLAGATRKIPTRYGYTQAGFGGGVEGGLQGLGLVSQIQQQKRALDKERRLSEVFNNLSAMQVPTGREISTGKPATTQAAPPDVSEGLDVAYGGQGGEAARAPTPATIPEMRPLVDKRLSGILGPIGQVAPELGAKALLDLATREKQVFSPGVGGLIERNPLTGETNRIAEPKPTYQRYERDLGDKVEEGYFNTLTGERTVTRMTPKGAAPEKPGEADLRRARAAYYGAMSRNVPVKGLGQAWQQFNQLYGRPPETDEEFNEFRKKQTEATRKPESALDEAIRRALETGPGGIPAGPAPTKSAITPAPTAVNPKTGQRIYLRNGRWEDEQGKPVQ